MDWILTAFLVVTVISGTTYYFLYRGWQQWPETQGTIESLLEIRRFGPNEPGPFWAVLSYSYSVNGQFYSGTWETPKFQKREQVMDFFHARLPVGTKIEVHYHPLHHNRSMAEPNLVNLDPAAPIALNLEGRGE